MKLKFQKFKAKDFKEYKSWFQDADLNRELGPMDQEWIDYTLKEKDGQTYGVFSKGKLVAVAEVKFPNPEHTYYVITSIAVKPSLRKKGIGSQVLQELVKLHSLKKNQYWKAFVNTKNKTAKLFLEKNAWICESEIPDEHGIITFELKQ